MKSSLNLTVVLVLLSLIAAPGEAGDSFYKETPLFPTAPRETVSSQLVARFGPVGIGIELVQPASTIGMAHRRIKIPIS